MIFYVFVALAQERQIEQSLSNVNLSTETMRCITSDGAADIRGKKKGVITRLTDSSGHTKVSIPCDLHVLQLALQNGIYDAFENNIGIGSLHPVQLAYLAINVVNLDRERFRIWVKDTGIEEKELLVAQSLPTLSRWHTVVDAMAFIVKWRYIGL